jgi:3-hydroxymyristoyl/3-hydroxydecanoyl-(acyl carrier protein) dehydratase
MIIQRFEFGVRAGGREVYRGETSFGFFTQAALAAQAGIREAADGFPSGNAIESGRGLDWPLSAPFTPDDPNGTWGGGLELPAKAYRMIDRVEGYLPEGGAPGLGFARAVKRVDPDEWFFKAHFYQDPVWPGSLGLESLIQVLKAVAVERWGGDAARWRFLTIAPGIEHEWSYRGQVLPTHKEVRVEAVVTRCDDAGRLIQADGRLSVDGLTIYRMRDFAIQAVEESPE